MATFVQPCLTCFRRTDNYLRITDETNADDVHRIVTTHFWFSDTECFASVLCTSCWEKIDEFHKFYCEVKRVHSDLADPVIPVQIKVEPIETDTEVAAVKREILPESFSKLDELVEKTGDINQMTLVGFKNEQEYKEMEPGEVPVKKKRGRKRKLPPQETKSEPEIETKNKVDKTENQPNSDESDNDFKEEQEGSDWDPSQDIDSDDEVLSKRKARKDASKPKRKYTPRKTKKNAEKRVPVPRCREEVAKEDELIRKYCSIFCSKCEFTSDTFNELRNHTKAVHNCNPMVICCEHRFYKRTFLYQHAQYHEDPEKFKCHVCVKFFHSGLALKLHMDYTHVTDEQKIFKCDECDASFAKSYHLTSHKMKHTSIAEKRFYCAPCDIAFRTNQSYKTHQHSKHGAAAKYVCDICARGFRQRSDLVTHQLSHTAEGLEQLKIQCEHCHKWMKNKKSIWTHRKICQSVGPVTCDICGKTAPNPEQLKNHKKFMHQDQRIYKCGYCDKAFKRPIDLKEHETIHTGEVLYTCNFCPKTFNSNSNLYSHRRKQHPLEYAEWKTALQLKKQPLATLPPETLPLASIPTTSGTAMGSLNSANRLPLPELGAPPLFMPPTTTMMIPSAHLLPPADERGEQYI
ncbi:transcription factor grauzone-like [Uranotaenia lowii]|uniref:transcription factor grauzone-like n=1 Tax=Uranotaenia lowii TaxID=190385 RepID=UPI002478FA9A|nr:transcription factor grauzone-like [Uranotaenia lowii]XP_055614072.1 transcription factor grauzone-like [Uranotaenia lowii]